MKRFLMIAAVGFMALTGLTVTQTQAAGRPGYGGSSHHGSYNDHGYRPSQHFDFGRFGYRSFSFTRSYWSSYYHCNCFYSPSYGWCFYEPSYSCYVPMSHYQEVYPQFSSVGPAPSFPSPTVIQQQTTIVGTTPTPGDVPVLPPPVAPTPVPAAIQQTRVGGPTVPAPIPAPVPVAPTALQQTKVP